MLPHKVQMKVSAYHMVDNLAAGLYESVGQRVMELIRNGLAASMPDPFRWEPQRAKIEISLVDSHYLSPRRGPALIVLDHGCGLTPSALDRYFNWLGTPINELRNRSKRGVNNGVSQKGIGRLAALALNENCLQDDLMARMSHGYYLLTRTEPFGQVRFVPVIPERAEVEQGFNTNNFVSPSAAEMQGISNIRGSFTAIVIPTPVFRSHDEIYESIKWFLPREADKMFELRIGGKAVSPPPFETEVNVSSNDGRFRARLGAGDKDSGGVWLCDSETSLRVASGINMRQHLPEPLWFPDLAGDLFAPGLLAHQNTARSTLAKEFMRKDNKVWAQFQMFLIRDVVPAAKALIERDAIRGEAAETLNELATLFNDRFGIPDEAAFMRMRPEGHRMQSAKTDGEQAQLRTKPPVQKAEQERPRYRRHLVIKVRDEVWTLYRGLSLSEFVFAQVMPDAQRMVQVNVRGNYKALPNTKLARLEHCLMQILIAIGMDKFPGDPIEAMRFANEIRSEFLTR